MSNLIRSLDILADDLPVKGFRRARLTGCDGIGLYPMPFTLQLWNLEDSVFYQLSAAKKLSVAHDGSELASGDVADVYRRAVPDGTLTDVVFASGLKLWNTPVSLTVNAGTKVSETVAAILENSGTGIALLSFPGDDPVRSRAQAFYGSAACAVETALTAAKARCYLTSAGLCIVPKEGVPVSMELSAGDLLDVPSELPGNLLLVRTKALGWLPGKKMSVSWKGGSATGLVIERSIDADTVEGNWQSELLMELDL